MKKNTGFYLAVAAMYLAAFYSCNHSSTVNDKTILVDTTFTMEPIKEFILTDRAFPIYDFGAETDATVNNRHTIAKARKKCSGEGGGKDVIHEGDWMTVTITAKGTVQI